uniref:HicA toxin of toxin-antitoxin n=1 Tax=Candidatus Kentrum sp. LPFa TaxID=2126335 RepID=A0A450VVG5_9GAMM|nr:MAG: HicA toxin of toxin-antitoxin [Candidatus Kentron sp. LPFa]VFK25863.1 MAG: HicA toxin of toxin-antitoxin [Candidatus Kentron sp. LPFa]
MKRHRPLVCKEVKQALKTLGFQPRPRKGTSHEQWVKEEEGRLRKVTVDCPKSPFGQDLIDSMAKQAGISKKEFYKIIDA